MKRNYYCLVAGLQDITLDIHKLSMGQVEFRNELQTEVHPQDYKLVQVLFFPFDNKNLLNIITKKEEEFDERGNFSRDLIEANIKELTGDLPDYMNRFITSFKDNEPVFPNMSHENQLTALFYEHAVSLYDEFLREWFSFNRDINNLLTALVCRRYDIPYEYQVIGRDEISETIRKSHARDFGLTAEIPYMDDLLNIAKEDDIQQREKAVDQLRWNYLEEVTFFEYFTIDKILAFTLKLGMVERWLALDKDYGTQLFEELLKDLKSSYELPETFTDK
ncbi:MAG: DUF2764 domain-containing protein [Bacteroidales bacterium]|nr:DUF2764 domain-containing protein [Bacteroidales bacterium]